MPLSISSSSNDSCSSHRAPDHPWKWVGLVSIILLSVVLSAWEILLASPSLGGKSYQDNEALWVTTRNKVPNYDNKAVVLVGASRIQVGINTDIFAKVTGIRPVQLAINGNYPLPVLEHLADTEGFTGVAIVSMNVSWLNPGLKSPTADQWIATYQAQHLDKEKQPFYTPLEQQLMSAWRTLGPGGVAQMSTGYLFESIFLGRRLPVRYIRVKKDRSVLVDYQARDVMERGGRDRFSTASMSQSKNTLDRFAKNIERVERFVDKIQARGGRVVFVRMPTSGNVRKDEESQYPREKYWDYFAKRTRALTIHFKDYPVLSGYTLPDGSHLDYRDAATFTESLSEIIMAMMVAR